MPPDPSARQAPVASAAASPRPAGGGWLFGPWTDVLAGCGGWYVLVFLLHAALGAPFREALGFGVVVLVFNVVASAHYGATVVRAYTRAEDRRAYALFTLWTTLLLGGAFVAGLASETFGSWAITVYLTWSPWHYALQNFGVAMTFLRRRGVAVSPAARRFLHLSFVTSFLMAATALHLTPANVSYAPNQLESGVYAFRPVGTLLGLPDAAGNAILFGVTGAWAVTTVAALVLLRRGSAWRALLPAGALVLTQALWFSLPVLARHLERLHGAGFLASLEPLSMEHSFYAFLWVGFGHVIQYLWITAWYARRAGESTGHGGFLLRSLLVGSALWWGPALLFAPGLLGRLPYDAGLASMVAALVNLHHFVLDGVLWKLRDARIAGILVRSESSGPKPAPFRPAVRLALWVGGFAVLGLGTAYGVLTEFGFNRSYERGDLAGAARAADRLDQLGLASAEQRLRIGHGALATGDLALAQSSFERSLALHETAWGWTGLGEVRHRQEQTVRAADAYARALALEPDHAVATFYAGVLDLEQGTFERGLQRVRRARQLAVADATADPQLVPRIDEVLAAFAPVKTPGRTPPPAGSAPPQDPRKSGGSSPGNR